MKTKHGVFISIFKTMTEMKSGSPQTRSKSVNGVSGFFSSFLRRIRILAQASRILVFVFLRGGSGGAL